LLQKVGVDAFVLRSQIERKMTHAGQSDRAVTKDPQAGQSDRAAMNLNRDSNGNDTSRDIQHQKG
jgi:hypothetical protein